MGSKLVIVESPAKSKTISKYLGQDYVILASFGHVRDLPSKDGSVDPEKDFLMHYQIKDKSDRAVAAIVKEAKSADIVYMASDPDREGEAIAWNLAEILKEKKIKVEIKRAAFSEITSNAVKDAIKNSREIDYNLVDAQQARLSLDYLVGFNVSPVLWQKLSGIKSAGRVQSVALRMIVEREAEIRAFIPSEYWSLEFNISVSDECILPVRVVEFSGKKLSNKFPKNLAEAQEIVKVVEENDVLKVINIESKEVKRNPFPPFNTSALQQDASNKLGFSADRTMKIAQKLYEGVDIAGETKGLITYMRTDGTTISNDALAVIREYIEESFGKDYLPSKARVYQTKTKNAQEAHEAIRPTDVNLSPKMAEKYLTSEEYKLYELIWRRTIACQMKEAIFLRQSIDFSDAKNLVLARANGSTVKFDGFLKVYEVKDNDDGSGVILPKVELEDEMKILQPIDPKQHFTSPKPRYTEASLVKELEEMGIGRPSTYVTIIKILQDRDYVRIEKRQFHPSLNGVVVTVFLKTFFPKYVEYSFTATLEEELDLISDGKFDRVSFLKKFWQEFNTCVQNVLAIDKLSVSSKIVTDIDGYVFSGNNAESRQCLACKSKNVEIRTGKFGVYVHCLDCEENSAIDKYAAGMVSSVEIKSDSPQDSNDVGLIGCDEAGNKIFKKTGKFGDYVERKSLSGEDPKRASIPKFITEIDLPMALKLLAMPSEIGMFEGERVSIGIGKFGPYILHKNVYYSAMRTVDFINLDLDSAVKYMQENPKKDKAKGGDGKYVKKTVSIGNHPQTDKPISIGKSGYGVYALYEKKFHTIATASEVSEVTLEMALDAIKNSKK